MGLLKPVRGARRRALGAVFALLVAPEVGCTVDDSVIYDAQPGVPGEVRPGIFRLTYHLEPDLYPTWIDSATVGYQGRGLSPFDTGFVLLQRSIHGGPATERERRFREQAAEFSLVPVAVPVIAGEPYLVYWVAATHGFQLCLRPCPPVASRGVRVLDPWASDSLALLPGWNLLFHRITDSLGVPNRHVDVRLLPEDLDALDRWRNPFGPAYGRALTPFYLSSGMTIFRASGTPAAPALDSVTAGSYPALSPDGSLLAFTRTALGDSTTGTCIVVLGAGACIQTTVTVSEGGRVIWVRDLTTGIERSLGPGAGPAFDVTATRIVVAAAGGLDWIDAASGARSGIPNTAGAHSPTVSPDGRHVAFVAEWEGQPDIYFMALSGP
jgi:hypothetical protein